MVTADVKVIHRLVGSQQTTVEKNHSAIKSTTCPTNDHTSWIDKPLAPANNSTVTGRELLSQRSVQRQSWAIKYRSASLCRSHFLLYLFLPKAKSEATARRRYCGQVSGWSGVVGLWFLIVFELALTHHGPWPDTILPHTAQRTPAHQPQ